TVRCHNGEIDYFSKLLDIPADKLKNLKRGQFAVDIAFQKPCIMVVPANVLTHRTMTPQEEAALRLRMKQDYGVQSEYTSEPAVETHKKINHFAVDALINGVAISMIVDTGATTTVLTQRTARLVGFRVAALDYSVQINTANGTTLMAAV